MVSANRILLDLNVVLDVLYRRESHFADSNRVLTLVESGRLVGYLAAHSWTTLFYLYAKSQSAERARVRITELLHFLGVAPVNQAAIERALNLPYRDFEDAVQMMAAVACGADLLVTRNAQDFAAGPLPVLTPTELLVRLST